jgi:hypothetical protein
VKRICLLGALGALMLTGCATDNAEDDAFFRRGWLWPKSMEEKPYRPEVSDASVDVQH